MKSRGLLIALVVSIVPLGRPALRSGTGATECRHEVISVLGGGLKSEPTAERALAQGARAIWAADRANN